MNETKALYHKTCEESQIMDANHRMRLAINLNYAVFLYDIARQVDEARDVAKRTFDAALENIESYNEDELNETLPVM